MAIIYIFIESLNQLFGFDSAKLNMLIRLKCQGISTSTLCWPGLAYLAFNFCWPWLLSCRGILVALLAAI